jgi:PII-like signaling protein
MGTKVLKFYLSNTDIIRHNSAYETIAVAAKHYGLAGATIYKGIMGYGQSSQLHSNKFWELNEKVPVIIEIVDEEENLRSFLDNILPWIDKLPKGCLITMQDVEIVLQKKGNKK